MRFIWAAGTSYRLQVSGSLKLMIADWRLKTGYWLLATNLKVRFADTFDYITCNQSRF